MVKPLGNLIIAPTWGEANRWVRGLKRLTAWKLQHVKFSAFLILVTASATDTEERSTGPEGVHSETLEHVRYAHVWILAQGIRNIWSPTYNYIRSGET